MALITVKDLVLGYEGQPIVEGLTFEVRKEDYLCIVGENGSGKTTLMKTLLKLQDPLSGTIELGDGLQRNEIGYLPQQTLVQKDFPASVREVVLSGCLGKGGFHPFYTREEKDLAGKQMERMEVLDLAERSIRDLSGGQQQRVLLARALCAAEKVLVLDEPAPEITIDENTVLSGDTAVDVDLTTISSSMVYSVVYNPDPYLGKTVKMQGTFTTIYDEENDKRYYACVIQDATACCSQGIEFVLKDERAYPEEYPEVGDVITVIGTFDSYTEGHYIYCTLNDAVMQ